MKRNNQQESIKKAFVTGGSGFVGANLVRRLVKENIEVHLIIQAKTNLWRLKDIQKKLHIHKVNLLSKAELTTLLQKIQPDAIFHLAAYGSHSYEEDVAAMIEINIRGTQNLLDASKDINYKIFINTGTSSEYGFKDKPMKESDLCEPNSFYASTKLAATTLCSVFAYLYKKPVVTLRLFSVYGPYEEKKRFIPTIILNLLDKKSIPLTKGVQRHDFIYIEDVINAFLIAAKKGEKLKGKVCNIGTGKEFTNLEVVQTLFSVTHKKTEIKKGFYQKRIWDTHHWVADTTNSKRLLAWKPKIPLKKGLQESHAWFINNSDLYESSK